MKETGGLSQPLRSLNRPNKTKQNKCLDLKRGLKKNPGRHADYPAVFFRAADCYFRRPCRFFPTLHVFFRDSNPCVRGSQQAKLPAKPNKRPLSGSREPAPRGSAAIPVFDPAPEYGYSPPQALKILGLRAVLPWRGRASYTRHGPEYGWLGGGISTASWFIRSQTRQQIRGGVRSVVLAPRWCEPLVISTGVAVGLV